MIEALLVMTYFKISLPTRNWDIAYLIHGLAHHEIIPYSAAKRAPLIEEWATGGN